MGRLVTIFGGSGFVGRYVTQRLVQQGWRVRVAVRRPNEALFLKPYGVVGQIEILLCNIRDDASVAAALKGADAVINCVGISEQKGRNTFDSVNVEGAARVASAAAAAGVARLVHLSALGADDAAASRFCRSKAAGEAAVLAAMPQAVILRPAPIFGAEDRLFNRWGFFATLSPVLLVPAPEAPVQPVWVDDVAEAAVAALTAPTGLYALGGPDVTTPRGMAETLLSVIRRRRLVWRLPQVLGRLFGALSDFSHAVSLGIIPKGFSRDEVKYLGDGLAVPQEAIGLAELGIAPMSMAVVLPDYVWRFRPSGQYLAIKDSAARLRKS